MTRAAAKAHFFAARLVRPSRRRGGGPDGGGLRGPPEGAEVGAGPVSERVDGAGFAAGSGPAFPAGSR